MHIFLKSHYNNEWIKIEAQNTSSNKWIATYPGEDGRPRKTRNYSNPTDAIYSGRVEAVQIHCRPGLIPRFKWGSSEDRDLEPWEKTLVEAISSIPELPFKTKQIMDRVREGVALVNMRPFSLDEPESDIWCYDVHWTDGTQDGGFYPEGIDDINKALGDPIRSAHHDRGTRVVIVILPDELSAPQTSEWWED